MVIDNMQGKTIQCFNNLYLHTEADVQRIDILAVDR